MSRLLLPLITFLVAVVAPLSASAASTPVAWQQDELPIVEAIRIEGGGEQEQAIMSAIQ